MNVRKYRILVLATAASLLLAAFSGCRPVRETYDPNDLSYIYNPSRNPFNPVISVFNDSESKSTISVKLYADDLFFTEANPSGLPKSSIQVSVKLYRLAGGISLADTARVTLDIKKEEGKKEYVSRIEVDAEWGYDYLAEIAFFDNILLKGTQKYQYFSKTSRLDASNFRVVEHDSGREVFTHVVHSGEYINLIYPQNQPDSIWVNYFPLTEGIPFPPYMVIPESSMPSRPVRKVAVAYSPTLPMMFPRTGIYTCSVNDQTLDGYTFMNFGDEFPRMTTPESMIGPLEYIATRNEIDSIAAQSNTKIALDEFWIKTGGNIPKGRELIRIFYNRVLFANYYFTSYTEGWRSDRGMIYIIYGPPDKVYRTAEGERWGYRKPEVKSSWGTRYKVKEEYLYFGFRKRANRFTDNDYVLNRNETAMTYWDVAIRTWRNGVVYRLDNPDDI